jgi:hypothetical protein
MRSIMNQASRLVLLLLAASTLTAGCGSSAQPRVASAGGTPTIAPTASVIAAYVDGVRAWVGCLRGEGVKVSDPDTRGNVEFDGDKRLLKADPKFRAAQQTCLSLLPAVPKGLETKPAMTAQEIQKAGEYAKCMRENGAPDFPDPGADGYYPEDANWNSGTDAALRAQQTCGLTVYGQKPGQAQG